MESSEAVGGLVGFHASGTISACYATGNASGSAFVGGSWDRIFLAQYVPAMQQGMRVEVAVLAGSWGRIHGTVTNSYFDSDCV